MDFDLNEEQKLLKKAVRDFIEKEYPSDKVRELEEDENEKGYSTEIWKKMAELGYMGLIFPEKYEGTEGSFLDLAILIEELGRALVSGPFIPTIVYSGLPILKFGTEDQKQGFIPKIARGEIVMTLALTEPSATFEAAGIEMDAVPEPEGDAYVINGTKLFVPDAHVADYLLCVTRTKGDVKDKEEGITVFLVPQNSAGIDYTLLKTIALDRQCEITFENVSVPKKNVLGEVDNGWQIIKEVMEYAAVAQCAFMLGGGQKVLEMTVDYAKKRVQFDRPIGSFQAIQHKCANIQTDLDGMRFITYDAAWRLSEGIPATLEVSMAKAWCSEAYRRICIEGHQIHGGVGIIVDHDMQLYFRRAKTAEVAFGDAEFHREEIAKELGL